MRMGLLHVRSSLLAEADRPALLVEGKRYAGLIQLDGLKLIPPSKYGLCVHVTEGPCNN